MSYYERGEGGEIARVREELPDEAVRAIERFDEGAIVQRMTTGIATEAFIYSYPIKTATGTKQIIGISTDGADEIARMLGNIEVLPDIKIDKDSDPDYFYAMIRVKDLIRNVTLLGTGRTCKFQIGKGNQPDHERPNEWAFVSSVSKAQRNGILHQTPEEVVIKIIDSWSKRGKSREIRPPILETEGQSPKPPVATTITPPPVATPSPQPEVTEARIAEQQERLKKLRMEVHNKFQIDLGIGVEKRKGMLSEKFEGVSSLTDLNEQQLMECLTWIEDMIEQRTVAPPTVAPTVVTPPPAEGKSAWAKLGFETTEEQGKLRARLYTILTASNQLNLKDDEAKKFITDRGFAATTEIPRDELIELIKEADELVKAKQTPGDF